MNTFALAVCSLIPRFPLHRPCHPHRSSLVPLLSNYLLFSPQSPFFSDRPLLPQSEAALDKTSHPNLSRLSSIGSHQRLK